MSTLPILSIKNIKNFFIGIIYQIRRLHLIFLLAPSRFVSSCKPWQFFIINKNVCQPSIYTHNNEWASNVPVANKVLGQSRRPVHPHLNFRYFFWIDLRCVSSHASMLLLRFRFVWRFYLFVCRWNISYFIGSLEEVQKINTRDFPWQCWDEEVVAIKSKWKPRRVLSWTRWCWCWLWCWWRCFFCNSETESNCKIRRKLSAYCQFFMESLRLYFSAKENIRNILGKESGPRRFVKLLDPLRRLFFVFNNATQLAPQTTCKIDWG